MVAGSNAPMSMPDSVSAASVASFDSAASLAAMVTVAVPIVVPPCEADTVTVSVGSSASSSVAVRVVETASSPAASVSEVSLSV